MRRLVRSEKLRVNSESRDGIEATRDCSHTYPTGLAFAGRFPPETSQTTAWKKMI